MPHSDLCSMNSSIELRSPFLDNNIVNNAMNIVGEQEANNIANTMEYNQASGNNAMNMTMNLPPQENIFNPLEPVMNEGNAGSFNNKENLLPILRT